MLCYGPLVSELGGGQSAWCPQPRHWGPVPPPGSAAYVDNTFRRSICRGEIFQVRGLGQSSRGKCPYFGDNGISF